MENSRYIVNALPRNFGKTQYVQKQAEETTDSYIINKDNFYGETTTPISMNPADAVPTVPHKKSRKHALNFNTENTNTQMVCELYAQGKIDKKGWSLMSPALRKMCERYAAKKKRESKRK